MNKASTFCQDSAAVTMRKWQIRLELLTELNMYMQVGQRKQIKMGNNQNNALTICCSC